jgi:hypothetical protein
MSNPRTLTLDDLKPREYEFEVIMPDDERAVFVMRAPSQAEMWEIERRLPEPQRDQFIDRKHPFNKDAEGNIIPIYDKEAFIEAQANRLQQIMYLKILAAWVDADAILGCASEEEQLAVMGSLGSWVISALWKMTQSLVVTPADAISARKFRGDRTPDHAGVRAPELDA